MSFARHRLGACRRCSASSGLPCLCRLRLKEHAVPIIRYVVPRANPASATVQCLNSRIHHRLHAEIELTVGFFGIDDVETVRSTSSSPRDLTEIGCIIIILIRMITLTLK